VTSQSNVAERQVTFQDQERKEQLALGPMGKLRKQPSYDRYSNLIQKTSPIVGGGGQIVSPQTLHYYYNEDTRNRGRQFNEEPLGYSPGTADPNNNS